MTELPAFIVLLVGLWVLVIVLTPVARILHIPLPLMLVIGGFGASEALVAMGVDTGLRWYSFRDVVLHVFLPLLIFRSALANNWQSIRQVALVSVSLAVPMLLLVVSITAVILYYGIGHATGFPWLAAIYAAVLISATDPAPILGYLNQTKAQPLKQWLENESLLNDAVVIVLFSVLGVWLLQADTANSSALQSLMIFLRVSAGAILLGVVLGVVANMLLPRLPDDHQQLVLLSLALGSAALSAQLGVSSVVTLMFAGLCIKGYEQDVFWRHTAATTSSMMFVLAGMTITLAMFETRWLAMLWGILAAFGARVISLLLCGPAINLGQRWLGRGEQKITWRRGLLLHWGGFRGTVTLALALSLPTNLDSWFTIQSIAYGVVIYGLLVHSTTFPWLHQKLQRIP